MPAGPGLWVPTPPAFVFPPLEPLAGTWRPWNLVSGSQFRPPPPPAFGSARFAAEVAGVHAVSCSLTDEQRAIALHSTSGAASTVLSRDFPSQARRLSDLAAEAAISRLYGGIHFRTDNDAGLELGRRVVETALRAYSLEKGLRAGDPALNLGDQRWIW